MTELRTAFDAESLGALSSVLDDICRELSTGSSATGADRTNINREQVAKLILHHAQGGVSDPAQLRTLVLNGISR